MFFVVTCSEVQEFLACAVHIRHILEHREIIDEGNHRDESGSLINRIRIVFVSYQVDHFLRRFYRSQVSTQQDALTFDVVTENL